MQGTWVRALVQEDPKCHGVTKSVGHNYWACVPQLLKPTCLEPVLCNKRSHRNEKPVHLNEEEAPLSATRERPHAAMKTQRSQKKKKKESQAMWVLGPILSLTLWTWGRSFSRRSQFPHYVLWIWRIFNDFFSFWWWGGGRHQNLFSKVTWKDNT